MTKRTKLGLAGGVIGLALLAVTAGPALAQTVPGRSSAPATTTVATAAQVAQLGMMGGRAAGGQGGMMGGGMAGGQGGMMGGGMASGQGGMMGGTPAQSDSPGAARALMNRAAAGASVNRQANTVTYQGANAEVVALASPEGSPDMTWTVDGLVNPTIIVRKGASVTVHFFDADNGTMHGWELSSTPPPYPYMAMMASHVAFPGAFAMPVAGATGQSWSGRTIQFTASTAGTYYYLCPVPGHAQKGMYGRLIAR
ncbi:MAG: cupredoxin domain-containing protein [Chloroflexota bacterium]